MLVGWVTSKLINKAKRNPYASYFIVLLILLQLKLLRPNQRNVTVRHVAELISIHRISSDRSKPKHNSGIPQRIVVYQGHRNVVKSASMQTSGKGGIRVHRGCC